MSWRGGLLAAILPVLAAAQQVTVATGVRAGLADNQQDCSFQGPVRSIEIARSAIEDGRESARELKASCIFDRNGHELEDRRYRDQGQYGKAIDRWLFLYDSHGRRTEGDIFDTNDDSRHPRRFLTKYDSKGCESENLSIDPDGSIDSRVVTEYDSRGDAVKETTYESDGKISGVTVRQYDAEHHLIREEGRGVNPEPASRKIFRYNNAGQRIEEIFDWEGSPARYLYSYDDRGRLRSFETITESNQAAMENDYGGCGDCGMLFPGKTTYRYDDNGLLTEERVIRPGNKLVRLSEYAYDSHGHHTREWVYSCDRAGKSADGIKVRVDGEDLLFDRTNGLPSTSYTYDSHGNWIKAVASYLPSDRDLHSGRIISGITYRVIRYY